MGFAEENLAAGAYGVVNTSSASVQVAASKASSIVRVVNNAKPTSAFLIYDGNSEDGTLLATVSASVLPGARLEYNAKLVNEAIGISAQSADTDITIVYR